MYLTICGNTNILGGNEDAARDMLSYQVRVDTIGMVRRHGGRRGEDKRQVA